MQTIAENPNSRNPKLEKLKEIILTKMNNIENSLCIVFVRTRALSVAILRWALDTLGILELNPARLTGNRRTENDKGKSLFLVFNTIIFIEFCI